jgi:hypothetical protein
MLNRLLSMVLLWTFVVPASAGLVSVRPWVELADSADLIVVGRLEKPLNSTPTLGGILTVEAVLAGAQTRPKSLQTIELAWHDADHSVSYQRRGLWFLHRRQGHAYLAQGGTQLPGLPIVDLQAQGLSVGKLQAVAAVLQQCIEADDGRISLALGLASTDPYRAALYRVDAMTELARFPSDMIEAALRRWQHAGTAQLQLLAALGQVARGDGSAVPDVADVMLQPQASDLPAARAVAHALPFFRDTALRPVARKLLASTDPDISQQALQMMRELATPADVPLLLAHLDASEPAARYAAAAALSRLSGIPVGSMDSYRGRESSLREQLRVWAASPASAANGTQNGPLPAVKKSVAP